MNQEIPPFPFLNSIPHSPARASSSKAGLAHCQGNTSSARLSAPLRCQFDLSQSSSFCYVDFTGKDGAEGFNLDFHFAIHILSKATT